MSEPAGIVPEPPFVDLLERSRLIVVGLVQVISCELSGHLRGALTDGDTRSDRAVAVTAEGIGPHLPLPGPPRTVGG